MNRDTTIKQNSQIQIPLLCRVLDTEEIIHSKSFIAANISNVEIILLQKEKRDSITLLFTCLHLLVRCSGVERSEFIGSLMASRPSVPCPASGQVAVFLLRPSYVVGMEYGFLATVTRRNKSLDVSLDSWPEKVHPHPIAGLLDTQVPGHYAFVCPLQDRCSMFAWNDKLLHLVALVILVCAVQEAVLFDECIGSLRVVAFVSFTLLFIAYS